MTWLPLFNRISLAFWLVMVPVSTLTGWVDSSRFISYLSEIALIWTALVCVQGDRQVRQVRDELVASTDVSDIEEQQE